MKVREMVDITEFKQEDWVNIYENLDDKRHLSVLGKKLLKSMQNNLRYRKERQ